MKIFYRSLTQRGMALFTVLVFMPIILILLGCIIQTTMAESYTLLLEKRSNQAFYLAQAGAEFAQFYFSSFNFEKFTHQDDNTPVSELSNRILPVPSSAKYGEGYSREDGWIKWEWDSSKPYPSFLGTPYNECYKFKIYPIDYMQGSIAKRDYVLKVKASLGYPNNLTVRTILMRGEYIDLFQYAIFDSGNLGEFIRGYDQTIKGKVYAFGDIYMNPNKDKLLSFRASNYNEGNSSMEPLLNSQSGKIYTSYKVYDKWGGTKDNFSNWQGAKINAQKANTLKTLVSIRGDGDSNNYDSTWSKWKTDAIKRWNGAVRDVSLNPEHHEMPSFESFMPNGYYYNEANKQGIIINKTGVVKVNGNTAGTDVNKVKAAITTEKKFWNPSEWRREEYVEVDVLKLLDPDKNGNINDKIWPENTILYCDTPVLIKNAAVLPGNTIIVSPYNVYIQGDFNMEQPPQLGNNWTWKTGSRPFDPNDTAFYPDFKKKSAAVCSTNKIYFFSGGFKPDDYDATNETGAFNKWGTTSINTQAKKAPQVSGEERKHTKDATKTIEFNALTIDGAKIDDDRYYVGNYTVKDKTTGKIKEDKDNPYYEKKTFDGDYHLPNGDQFVEDWGASDTDRYTLLRRGAIVHKQDGSTMADFDNSNVGPGVVGWTCATRYRPPKRDYGYDPSGAQSYTIDHLPKSVKAKSWQVGGSSF